MTLLIAFSASLSATVTGESSALASSPRSSCDFLKYLRVIPAAASAAWCATRTAAPTVPV